MQKVHRIYISNVLSFNNCFFLKKGKRNMLHSLHNDTCFYLAKKKMVSVQQFLSRRYNHTVSQSNPTQISQVNRVVKDTVRLFRAKLFKTSFYSCAIYDSCYLLKNDPMQECRESIDRLHFQVSLSGFTPCWLDSQYPKPAVNISWV